MQEDTPKIEYEIGGAINTALEQKNATKPLVNLTNPDITINAEVLGPITFLGIVRKDWQITTQTEDMVSKQPQPEVSDLQMQRHTN